MRRRHRGRSDFDMDVTRKSDAKGDRVQIGMTSKFLPFKFYGATGNEQAYGYNEEWRRRAISARGMQLRSSALQV